MQEVAKLRRSLDDAEGLSRDTKKEWAVLRSQNIDLEEMNVSGMYTLEKSILGGVLLFTPHQSLIDGVHTSINKINKWWLNKFRISEVVTVVRTLSAVWSVLVSWHYVCLCLLSSYCL